MLLCLSVSRCAYAPSARRRPCGTIGLLATVVAFVLIASPLAPPVAAGSGPSGEAMPVGDQPGWRQIFADDFAVDAPVGSFESTYSAKWDGYHDGWRDSSGAGQYFPSRVLSAHDGALDMYLHTENGIHMGAAPVPSIPNPAGSYHGQLYGRYTVRFRADPIAGYSAAWLLWPDNGAWPQAGEIDYPEGELNGTFAAYMHRLNATSGGDQDYYERLGSYTSWHTATTEWRPDSVTFYLDGQVVGRSTARIPNTPMHWVLQTEAHPNGAHPAATDAGHVLIDWVAIYAFDPTIAPSSGPVAATIAAAPNPVPVGQTTTTVTASTGDSSTGTVCVSDNGKAATIFDGNVASHSMDAPFINSGSYVFALHKGVDCTGAVLASVTVTKRVPNTSAAPIALSFTSSTTHLVRSYTGNFDSGDGSVVQVMLSVNGDTERLFAQAQFGTLDAPWIFSGVYTFRIVKNGQTYGTITVATTVQISSPNGTTAGGPSPDVKTTVGKPVLLTFDTGTGQPAALCTQYGGLVSFSQNGAGYATVNNSGTVNYDLHIGSCTGPKATPGTVTITTT